MPDRLSPLDVSFLHVEDPTTPMHVGSVAVFERPDGGFDHAALMGLLRQRIAFVPRYRQRVRWVPGHLASPVWVDDETFDLAYHVRRSALPRPGSDEQLAELVGRLMSRRLDRLHPLWEVYLVEGLPDGRFAIVTKTHHSLVDGVGAVDIAQVILDPTPEPRPTPPDTWRPTPEPSWLELVAGAAGDVVRRPAAAVHILRGGLSELTTTAGRVLDTAGGVLAMARRASRAAPESPLTGVVGEQRRFASVDTDLEDYRRVSRSHGCTVNDVVLTVVTGALRTWLLTRGHPVTPTSVVRALVPVSVRALDSDQAPGPDQPGQQEPAESAGLVSSYLVPLPVGEGDPVVRLHRVAYAMRPHQATGQAIGARRLIGLAGFAPPTLHSLGARVATSLSRRLFATVVTNVPGPQHALYAAGARMVAAYPVVPLGPGQTVSIASTSYDGGVFYGLNADRDAVPDLQVLGEGLTEALVELVGTAR